MSCVRLFCTLPCQQEKRAHCAHGLHAEIDVMYI